MARRKGKKLTPEQQKELNELRRIVTQELRDLKAEKFPGVKDLAFDQLTGVSRASLPGIELGTSMPTLETIYLWVTACGSTLQEFFRSPSAFYGESTRRLHEHLEYILKTQGLTHWLRGAVESEYARVGPHPRKVREPDSPSSGEGQEAEVGTKGRQRKKHHAM